MKQLKLVMAIAVLVLTATTFASAQEIVHDAEYYILEAQHGERWSAEDKDIDKRLAELKKEYGTPPNIIYDNNV